MYKFKRTLGYKAWFNKLRDLKGKAKIKVRLKRLSEGNPSDHKALGSGVVELRIKTGPGYRVYYIQKDDVLIVLLAGGDKSTQSQDIKTAKALAKEL